MEWVLPMVHWARGIRALRQTTGKMINWVASELRIVSGKTSRTAGTLNGVLSSVRNPDGSSFSSITALMWLAA